MPKPSRPDRAPVDPVDLHERVDQLVADRRALLGRVDRRRDVRDDHVALDLLHHVERAADHLLVLADREHRRHAARRPPAPAAAAPRAARRGRSAAAAGAAGGAARPRVSPRLIRYVTFECPSPIGTASISPSPRPWASRNAASGSRISSGGRSLPAACSALCTMSSGAMAVLTDRKLHVNRPAGPQPCAPVGVISLHAPDQKAHPHHARLCPRVRRPQRCTCDRLAQPGQLLRGLQRSAECPHASPRAGPDAGARRQGAARRAVLERGRARRHERDQAVVRHDATPATTPGANSTI